MNNQLETLLRIWHAERDTLNWVLVTVIGTEGSSYRRPGAMMLFNDSGEQFGLVSGGCLESDVLKHARQCWQLGTSKRITYDMREEGDLAWNLGIGCGGKVDLLLQPVNADNDYLQLDLVYRALEQDQSGFFAQPINDEQPQGVWSDTELQQPDWLSFAIKPAPTVLVLGGGVDAVPVVSMGHQLGWKMWVNDPRPRYARRSDFVNAQRGSNLAPLALADHEHLAKVSAVIVMHHSVELDAQALQLTLLPTAAHIGYIGLLGPGHRTERVLDNAGIGLAALQGRLANPIGLRLGGDLPESLALAMLAEIHAWLNQQDGQSISQILGTT
ncbi:XdhC family protein [Alteromonas sp. ASW11-36]|uniref:XdhC family protein n=1 Tax=Alteromonas arenosi TaxID=3055817 RepID=A0ABT7SXS0_9ALTE|nr:XdhC family protein [Alteromonas sp. ASW11-36]MDM7860971.1 XdhC family protein [Alteromonas sp. ASW11-36]